MRQPQVIVLSMVGAALYCMPLFAYAAAGNYTAPISPTGSAAINSFFDHTSPTYGSNGNMTKYDGNVWTSNVDLLHCTKKLNCYDNHNGLDYNTLSMEGKDVLAAAPGTVREVRWEDPNDHTTNFGFYVRLWHPDYGQTTLYAHTTSVPAKVIVHVGDKVTRSQKIAVSGSTGSASLNGWSPHLHFSVYSGDTSVTSYSSSIDPDGWLGSGQDPWTLDKGYLWAVSSTSLSLFTTVSGDITSSTTWLPGVYVVNGTVNITSGARLNINRDAVIKFKTTTSKLVVANGGVLDAEGTASSVIYFTSYKDDSVGGDTNGDATSTTAAAGDWSPIELDSGASSTIAYAVVRYGGYNGIGGTFPSDLYNNGGMLTLNTVEVANGNSYGFYQGSGTSTTISSNFHDSTTNFQADGGVATASLSSFHNASNYGVYKGQATSLTLTSNTFAANAGGAVKIDLDYDAVFTHSGNTASGTGEGGIVMFGPLPSGANDQTWTNDSMPYIISKQSPVSIPSGRTLTISPGAIVKLEGTGSGTVAKLTMSGTLRANGTSASSIYFTSLQDDSVGGDTNGDATSTTPAAGNWDTIEFDSGSSSISNAVVRYGGHAVGASLYNNGATLNLVSTEVATSSTYGIYQASGSTTSTKTEIHHQGYGLDIEGGTASATSSSFHNDSTDGVFNNTGVTLNFESNYWGASDGPGPVGTGHGVNISTNVDYANPLPSWP